MKRAPLAILILFSLVLLSGCVERFNPDEGRLRLGLLVINAHITDEPVIQHIEISRSTDMESPLFAPELNCYTVLVREDGEIREFLPSSPGYYSCQLDEEFLRTGASFQVQVFTQDGNEYHSDFDRLRPVPAIDSIYYQVERHSFASADDVEEGIRFFIDFTFDNGEYEYIRWEQTETYEFHNPYLERVWYLPNRWRTYEIPSNERARVCYITKRISDLQSLSMENLDFGLYIKKPLSFIPNIQNEQKLHHKYALLVRQYSVGEEAYHYWNELQKTSQEQGFLFDSQPALLQSNICNVHDEEEHVLGFFSMSGVQTVRGIATDLDELDRTPNKYYCLPVDRGPGSNLPRYPAWMSRATYDGQTVTSLTNEHCVDCRAYDNSTDVKPDYW